MLFTIAVLWWNPFNWDRDDKDWETQQEAQAVDGLVTDEKAFQEMDQMGLIPETPWGETGEHEAAPTPPPEDSGPPKWLRWLGL